MGANIHRVVLSLAACALLCATALAGGKTKTVTFSNDVKLGGTVVKKGTYKVSFDEETKELSVLSGGKVVAKSTARLEEHTSSPGRRGMVYTTIADGDGARLLLLVNMGDKDAAVSDRHTAQAGRSSDAN